MHSSSIPGARRSLLLLLAFSLSATAAACSDDSDDDGAPATNLAVVASTLEAKLTEAGVDAANPPTWATVEQIWVSKESEGHPAVLAAATPLMTLFSESLGIECLQCHTNADHTVPEDRRNIVAGMWDEWVHGVRLKEGGLLFCDSCHQGKEEFLERGDEVALESWMQVNFVANFTRVDGRPQSCASCHNQPFDEEFLDKWAMGQYPTAP